MYAKNKPETVKAAAIRPPFSLGKGGDVRVNILAKPGAKLSAITALTEVRNIQNAVGFAVC